ncbi:hypothetical protein QUA75_06315 [Microcoleus sp. M2_C6]|uniref:hypothetical protein n=1 Tax=Microcoleus sp. M2-A5 TaxID=2818816 RepID=UPI002FD3AC41
MRGHLSECEAAVAGGFACCADSTLYTLNVTEVEITVVMPVFHSLMQQFLAAESDSNRWLWKIGFIAVKALLYKHSELLCAWGDRSLRWG